MQALQQSSLPKYCSWTRLTSRKWKPSGRAGKTNAGESSSSNRSTRFADAKDCFALFEPVKQDEIYHLEADLSIRFRNSGHILGSSFLEIWEGPPDSAPKTVFTGDLGYKGQLIVEAPEILTEADILFMESTYGNRNHKSLEQSEQELLNAIQYSYSHGEKVIIPAFAVERTQELLFILGKFFREKLIPPMPVYLDSPLAIAATTIFSQHETVL